MQKTFYQKLKNQILSYKASPLIIGDLIEKYDWQKIVSLYDKTLNDFK